MVLYRDIFSEDYTDIVKYKESNQKLSIKENIFSYFNKLFNKHISISDYELWMFSKLAYSNGGINLDFIDKYYNSKFEIIDFINEEDGLQFYVIKSRLTKDLIISFRGTDQWIDWLTNIQIVKSKKKQFDTAILNLEKIFSKFLNYDIYFCGHSLGGALSQYLFIHFYEFNNISLKRAVTFNSAGIRGKTEDNYYNLPIINYIIEKDMVGVNTGYHFGKIFFVKPKIIRNYKFLNLHTHSLDQFTFDSKGNVDNIIIKT